MQVLDHHVSKLPGEVIKSVVEIIASKELQQQQHIVETILLGSATTGEMCQMTGTSDLDLLLVVHDYVDDDACYEIKAGLRRRFATSRLAEKSAGLRCRYVNELISFSRYLALQGYHASHSIPLYGYITRPNGLPEFDRRAASREEYLCVLGECLWGELRCRAQQGTSHEVDCYLEAKTLLSYINLLLVAEGVFLPTHAERGAYWKGSYGRELQWTIDSAVSAKIGVFTGVRWRDLHQGTKALRKAACKRWQACAAVSTAEIDPAMFWMPHDAAARSSERCAAMSQICEILMEVLEKHDADRALAKASSWSSPMSTSSPFVNVVAAQANVPVRQLVAQIHTHRIASSEGSRRDWGHIKVVPDHTDASNRI